MFIKSLTLCGYKRLLPSDVKYLHIDFKLTHQLLLGMNGSGKSSVLIELNPMPASPQDYLKNGYKVIEIEHKNQLYRLSSFFDTGARHSFVLNNLEMNEGGTALVQKQLVLDHFSIDNELIEVLTDQTRFHLFSPLERRNWLTRLSGTNMDFALGFFKFVKDQLRDTESIIKYTDARLAKESGDIMTEEQLQILKSEAASLDEIIKEMINNKSSSNDSPKIALDALESLSNEALALSSHIVSIKLNRPVNASDNHLGLIEQIDTVRQQIEFNEGIRHSFYNDYSRLKEALEIHSEVENTDLDALTRELKDINNQIHTLQHDIRVYPTLTNIDELYGATLAIKNSLLNRINDLEDNSDGKYNRQTIESKRVALSLVNEQLTAIDNKLNDLKVSLNRLSNVDDVHCPKCDFEFKPGVSPVVIEQIKTHIQNGEQKYKVEEKNRIELEDYLSSAGSYASAYQVMLNLMSESANLKPVWDNMKKVDLTVNHPDKLIQCFYTWERELQSHLSISKLMLKAAAIEANIEKLNAVQDNEISRVKLQIEEVSNNISNIDAKLSNLKTNLSNLVDYKNAHDSIIAGYDKLKVILDKRDEYKKKYMNDFSQALLLKYMGEITVHKVKIDEQISSVSKILETVKHLEQEKLQYQNRKELLKKIIKELNPTDGLIAKQSKLFIEQFVEQINKVINAVWTYEMKVLPCATESDKLTYKFPIYFPSTEAYTQDIAKASTAQKGIIDFAFKLIVMAYLGLTDYPLYLDELGASLDEKHRVAIMDFVKNFVEAGECSQMFLISHYHSGHGVFSNAEVTVLDDTNLLTKPDNFNKHVTISNRLRAYKAEE